MTGFLPTFGDFSPSGRVLRPFRSLGSGCFYQRPSCQSAIAQGKRRENQRRVPGQSVVPRLDFTRLTHDHPWRMIVRGPIWRFAVSESFGDLAYALVLNRVPDRIWRTDGGSVHDHTFSDQQSFLTQQCDDLDPNSRNQMMVLEQSSRVQDRGLTGRARVGERHPGKLADTMVVVERMLAAFDHSVRASQPKPQQREVDSQYCVEKVRWSTISVSGAHKFDQFRQRVSKRNLRYFAQRRLAACLPASGTLLLTVTAQLGHGRNDRRIDSSGRAVNLSGGSANLRNFSEKP